jgi:multidrug resistance efflux pump
MKTRAILLIGVSALLGLVGAMWPRLGSSQGPALLADTTRRPRPTSVAAEGIVEGARPEVPLRAEVQGTILRMLVKENQQVRKGDLLVELSNATQKGRLLLARAELDIARADRDRVRNGERKEKRDAVAALVEARRATLDQASKEMQRARRIATTRAGSQEDFDQKSAAHARAKADLNNALAEKALVNAEARVEDMQAADGRVAAAEARIQLAEAELAKTRLVAPSDGIALQTFAEPGEVTGPSSTQPILILANMATRRVRAFVEELDVAHLREGQEAVVTAEGFPGKEFAGKVVVIVPRMGKRAPQSDQPNEYKDLYFQEVLIDLQPGTQLPLNLRVRTTIHIPPQTIADSEGQGTFHAPTRK